MSQLRTLTQEFESLFIQQMLNAMRQSVPEAKLMGGGSGEKMFRALLDEEFSRQSAFAGGMGIADLLYSQLGSRFDYFTTTESVIQKIEEPQRIEVNQDAHR
jgi:Rod binding domain-containing protein